MPARGSQSSDLPSVAGYLASSPARLLAIALEDVLDVRDQPNVPGTIDEHPNWRRKLPLELARIRDDPRLAAIARIAADTRQSRTRRDVDPRNRTRPSRVRPGRREAGETIDGLRCAQIPPAAPLNQNGRWLMRFRGKRVEFVDRQSALREAILEAFEHGQNGTPTQVICIDDHLALEIVWTYGVDPDRPALLPTLRNGRTADAR